MTTTPLPPLPVPDPVAELQRLFGFSEFRPGQQETVRAVLDHEDVLAVMPTGAGKSLCYQLPAMLLPGCTVVISPLIALMKDQLDSLPTELRDRAAIFNSSVERDELDAGMADLTAGRLKLVYVAPERLRQRPFLHALARARISRFVVDEAHCVSMWGHDFRPDYLFIPTVLELLNDPPVLAMTATATPAIQRELQQRFARPLRVLHTGVVRPNLSLEVVQVRNADEKLRRLVDLCREEHARGSGIVYVSSRKNAEDVARTLRSHGINARHYHAGLESGERAEVQDSFMQGRLRVIVATVAFGMGVNKRDVRFIVHFNPSRSLEAYAQESGRAGRDGLPARCVLFWATSDKTSLARWTRQDTLSRDVLQAVYRAVRQDQPPRYAWWPLDRLLHATRAAAAAAGVTAAVIETISETDVRVALGALEQVGVVRRHCDLPEVVHLRFALGLFGEPLDMAGRLDASAVEDMPVEGEADVSRAPEPRSARGDENGLSASPLPREVREVTRSPSPQAAEHGLSAQLLLDALDAAPGERASIESLHLAERLNCPPWQLEERLLDARDAGLLDCYGVGRGLLIERFPHPADLGQRLRDLLDGHEQAQIARLNEIEAYATEWSCRAATIARHFGVAYEGRCGNCDVCQGPEQADARSPRRVATPAARPTSELDRAPEDAIIAAIAELPFPMGRTGVSRLLAGSIKSTVQADRSRYFGMLTGISEKAIVAEIDRLLAEGYLEMDASEYRLLSVTAAGAGKPAAPWPPLARAAGGSAGRAATRGPSGQTAPVTSLTGAAFDADDAWMAERFEQLREWRLEESRRSGLSPAYVFPNETLQHLAAAQITARHDLARIKGVGPAKLEKYGDALLELLAE